MRNRVLRMDVGSACRVLDNQHVGVVNSYISVRRRQHDLLFITSGNADGVL